MVFSTVSSVIVTFAIILSVVFFISWIVNKSDTKEYIETPHPTEELGKLKQLLEIDKVNIKNLEDDRDLLLKRLVEEQEKNRVVISQKKSSEVRLGQISENITPFLEAFPYNPKNAHFLGQPIDFIVFDYDQGKIIFLEVKTGNAKESHRQKLIKNIVKSGHVYYEKMQINEKGIKVQMAENL